MWIDPTSGVADTSGNAQVSALNRWVPLRLAVPVNFKVGPTAPGAVVRVPTGLPQNDPILVDPRRWGRRSRQPEGCASPCAIRPIRPASAA